MSENKKLNFNFNMSGGKNGEEIWITGMIENNGHFRFTAENITEGFMLIDELIRMYESYAAELKDMPQ